MDEAINSQIMTYHDYALDFSSSTNLDQVLKSLSLELEQTGWSKGVGLNGGGARRTKEQSRMSHIHGNIAVKQTGSLSPKQNNNKKTKHLKKKKKNYTSPWGNVVH